MGQPSGGGAAVGVGEVYRPAGGGAELLVACDEDLLLARRGGAWAEVPLEEAGPLERLKGCSVGALAQAWGVRAAEIDTQIMRHARKRLERLDENRRALEEGWARSLEAEAERGPDAPAPRPPRPRPAPAPDPIPWVDPITFTEPPVAATISEEPPVKRFKKVCPPPCGVGFTAHAAAAKYHSDECREMARQARIEAEADDDEADDDDDEGDDVRSCRECGCTDAAACVVDLQGTPCGWVEEDLCSACTPEDVEFEASVGRAVERAARRAQEVPIGEAALVAIALGETLAARLRAVADALEGLGAQGDGDGA